MQTTIDSAIDAYIEPNTKWNLDAKHAWEQGHVVALLDTVCAYYDSKEHSDDEL